MTLDIAASSKMQTANPGHVAHSADRMVFRIEFFAGVALGISGLGAWIFALLGPMYIGALHLFAILFIAIIALGAVAVCAAYVHFACITPPGVPLSQRSVALQSLVWLGRWVGGGAVMVVSAMAGADLAIPGNGVKGAGQYFLGALLLGPPVASLAMGVRLALAGRADKRAAWIGQWVRSATPHGALTARRLWLAAIRRWTRSWGTLPPLFFVPYAMTLVVAASLAL